MTLVAVAPLAKVSPIETMIASSYQAVSGAGLAGMRELTEEIEAGLRGEPYEPKAFAHQIAYNVIPQIGSEQFMGYTSEEMKMQNEGRKILHLPEMQVSCTCVRVPVVRSHSVSVVLRTKEKITVDRARSLIAAAPAASWWMTFPTMCTPCPSTPRTRTWSSWAASGTISPPTGASTSGAAATRSARARPPTRSRSRNCCCKTPYNNTEEQGCYGKALLFSYYNVGCCPLT